MAPAIKRVKNIAITRPIIYGNTATPLTAELRQQFPNASQDHTHAWTIFVRSPSPDDDLSYLIKKVVFKLHDTYANSSRTVEGPGPFEVTETGWGEFEIAIRIYFAPETNEKNVQLYHHLKLHPYGSGDTSVPSSSSLLSGGMQMRASSSMPSAQIESNAPDNNSSNNNNNNKTTPAVKREEIESNANVIASSTSVLASSAGSATTSTTSEAATDEKNENDNNNDNNTTEDVPIESYVYDELVFNEPTEPMFETLTSKPGAVLPAKKTPAHIYSVQTESEELERLSAGLETVYQQVQKTKELILSLEQEKVRLEDPAASAQVAASK